MVGDHRHCGSGNIMVLVCNIIFEDHVTKESRNSLSWNPSRYVAILLSLLAIGIVVVKV